ncbi:MAG: transporter substrate-binding domain-containing protein [Anaerolineae bacterium]
MAFAFPPGSDLIDPINQAKAYLEATGRWDQIYVRWFEKPDLPDLGGAQLPSRWKMPTPRTTTSTTMARALAGITIPSTTSADCSTACQSSSRWHGTGCCWRSLKGKVDVAADGITYTEERDETVDFSTLYQAYDETLLVRGDEDRFSSAEELKAIDYIVGTQLGTTNELTSQEVFGDAHIKSYDQFPAAVQALINGEVDAVEIDRPAGLAFTVTQGNLRVLDEKLSPPRGWRSLSRLAPTSSTPSIRQKQRWKQTAHGTISTARGLKARAYRDEGAALVRPFSNVWVGTHGAIDNCPN